MIQAALAEIVSYTMSKLHGVCIHDHSSNNRFDITTTLVHWLDKRYLATDHELWHSVQLQLVRH